VHQIFPLKIVEEEKQDHFDLIFIMNSEKFHYAYISNFSRIIRSQITGHKESVLFCKSCFTTFDNQNCKYKLSGEGALEQHKSICGSHKAILPLMPPVNTKFEFKNFKNTIRHPIVIYSNFEAMLVKTNKQKGDNTVIINKHVPISFGFVLNRGKTSH